MSKYFNVALTDAFLFVVEGSISSQWGRAAHNYFAFTDARAMAIEGGDFLQSREIYYLQYAFTDANGSAIEGSMRFHFSHKCKHNNALTDAFSCAVEGSSHIQFNAFTDAMAMAVEGGSYFRNTTIQQVQQEHLFSKFTAFTDAMAMAVEGGNYYDDACSRTYHFNPRCQMQRTCSKFDDTRRDLVDQSLHNLSFQDLDLFIVIRAIALLTPSCLMDWGVPNPFSQLAGCPGLIPT